MPPLSQAATVNVAYSGHHIKIAVDWTLLVTHCTLYRWPRRARRAGTRWAGTISDICSVSLCPSNRVRPAGRGETAAGQSVRDKRSPANAGFYVDNDNLQDQQAVGVCCAWSSRQRACVQLMSAYFNVMLRWTYANFLHPAAVFRLLLLFCFVKSVFECRRLAGWTFLLK